MATEFVSRATERLVQILTSMGLPPDEAGMAAQSWQQWMSDEWGGDRPYIGREADAQRERSRRDRALLAEHAAGERVPYLARRYRISERRVRQIITELAAPDGNDLP